MKLCKKGQKKLKYKSDFIITKMILNGVLYYSVDGINFSHSRTQRVNISNLYFSNISDFNNIDVQEVSKISDQTEIKNIPRGKLSMKVNNLFEILILINEI